MALGKSGHACLWKVFPDHQKVEPRRLLLDACLRSRSACSRSTSLNDCALQEPNVVDALAHQQRIFIKCFHQDKIWIVGDMKQASKQLCCWVFKGSLPFPVWHENKRTMSAEMTRVMRKPNFHIPLLQGEIISNLKRVTTRVESRPYGYYQVTSESTNMELCHAKCLFRKFRFCYCCKMVHLLSQQSEERATLANHGLGQDEEFREGLHYESTPFFLLCLLTHNFIIFQSLFLSFPFLINWLVFFPGPFSSESQLIFLSFFPFLFRGK